MKKITIMAAALAIAVSAAAQPGQQQKAFPGKPGEKMEPMTVEQEAQMKTDQMSSELPLTDKQVKKVYKYHRKDIKYRREHFQKGGGTRPEGMPQHGNGMGRPEGMPPQSGNFQGGRQGMGGPGMGGPGMGPGGKPQMDEDVDFEKMEKYNLKQEKKLKKIIGEENYNLWRSHHKMAAPALPDPEFN